MAAATAGGFVLLGIALSVLHSRRMIWLVQLCALAAGFMAILCIMGYAVGASSLYAINIFRSVAFHTAWLFFFGAAATLSFLPRTGLLGILTGPGAGGQMARRLLPIALFVPLIMGILRIAAHRAGLIDIPFGIAAVACSNMVLLVSAIYWCARSLETTDTRRKRTEASFRRVVESAPNAMVIVDRDGRIAMVNGQLEKLFEYPQSRLLGHSIELLVPDHMRDHHSRRRAAFLAAPVKRPMATTRELYGRRRNGSQFPVEIGLTPVEFEGELMVVCTVVDLTQRRRAEQRDRERLAELAHVGRLSTVGEMISGLAHEINQPLAAACNYARACARFANSGEGATVEQIAELVDKTLAQTERANQIVSRMCAFVRKGTPTRTAVDMNQVVRDVISLTIPAAWQRSSAPDRVTIQVHADKSLPSAWGDRVQIEQVLVNLVRNAIDAMQGCDSAARQLEITTSFANDGVTVVVADSGSGVAAEHLARVFDPFFTTKSDGIGLGLSLSRSIIEAHNGRLWHEPGTRGGARFAFWLPCGNTKEAAA
jgi:two-component system sensor kinase FixL